MKRVFVLVVVCVLVFSCLAMVCRADDQSDASAAVASAQQRIVVCYNLAADAAKAGANVSGLLTNLTLAGNLLSNATLAFANGDYNNSDALAVQGEQVLVGFEGQAAVLKTAGERDAYVNFWFDIVGSSVGAVAVVVCAFVVWYVLKKKTIVG